MSKKNMNTMQENILAAPHGEPLLGFNELNSGIYESFTGNEWDDSFIGEGGYIMDQWECFANNKLNGIASNVHIPVPNVNIQQNDFKYHNSLHIYPKKINIIGSPNISELPSPSSYTGSDIADTLFVDDDFDYKLLHNFENTSNLLDDLGDISDIINLPNSPLEENLDVIDLIIAENFRIPDHGDATLSNDHIDDLSHYVTKILNNKSVTNSPSVSVEQTMFFSGLDSNPINYLSYSVETLKENESINTFYIPSSPADNPINLPIRNETFLPDSKLPNIASLNENITSEYHSKLDQQIPKDKVTFFSLMKNDNFSSLDKDFNNQHFSTNTVKRKREQNKVAATKYRQKLQKEKDNFETNLSLEAEKNRNLRDGIIDIEKEIKYLKNLLLEIDNRSS